MKVRRVAFLVDCPEDHRLVLDQWASRFARYDASVQYVGERVVDRKPAEPAE